MSDTLLTEAEAARYIGMSVSWLRNGRCYDREGQPPYFKISNRVRYRRTDLDDWLADRHVQPAGGAAAA